MDMEDDVRATSELSDAVYAILETGAVHGLDPRSVSAVLRVVSHLQGHTTETLRRWEEAVRVSRAV